jgi:putative heme iron utilization protein
MVAGGLKEETPMTASPLHVVRLLVLMLPCAAPAADAPAVCATAAQAEAARALYAVTPHPAPFQAATKLGMPEAAVLSALPPERAVGTPGSSFGEVWASLAGWDRSLTLVLKGGQVFEIFGKVPAGEPSKKSRYFNLTYPQAGLGGHLRSDLIGSIYAVSLQGAEGPMRGIAFLDAEGADLFHVFLPESLGPTPAEVAQFEKTRAVVAGLPRACP